MKDQTMTINRTVNMDVGSYREGQTLTEVADILGYFDALYALSTEPPATFRNQLTDSEAMAIIDAIQGTDGPSDLERINKLTEACKVKPQITAAGSKIRQAGIQFGVRLQQAGADSLLADGVLARITREDLPLDLAIKIDATMPRGHNGKITAPFPGVTSDLEVKDNNGQTLAKLHTENPDQWVAQIGGKRATGSYYGDAAAQMDTYKLYQKVIDMVDFVIGGAGAPVDVDQSVTIPNGETYTLQHFRNMAKKTYTLGTIKSRMRDAQNDYTSRLRVAVRLLMQIEHVAEMPKIGVEIACEEKHGAPGLKLSGVEVIPVGFDRVRTRNTIYVYRKGVQGSALDPMAVSSFNAMVIRGGINDPYNSPIAVPKAVGLDATPDELKATIKRETGSNKTVAKVVSINDGDIDRASDYIAEIAAWLPNNLQSIYNAVANNKLGDDLALSIETIYDNVDAIMTNVNFRARLDKVKAKAKELQDAEDKARKEALKNVG